MPTREQLVAANDATYAAWNAHDPDAVAAVFAVGAELRDAGNPEPVKGRDAIRERAAGLLEQFPDFHLERVQLIVEPPRNADRWIATATHAETGRPVRVEGATFTELDDDGLVIRDFNFIDTAALQAQLSG